MLLFINKFKNQFIFNLIIQDRHINYVKASSYCKACEILENKLIPTGIDYARVKGLRNEAISKFSQFTPRSLGQALRISGITPADVTVLAIHLQRS